jgi:hypothetical protein
MTGEWFHCKVPCPSPESVLKECSKFLQTATLLAHHLKTWHGLDILTLEGVQQLTMPPK